MTESEVKLVRKKHVKLRSTSKACRSVLPGRVGSLCPAHVCSPLLKSPYEKPCFLFTCSQNHLSFLGYLEWSHDITLFRETSAVDLTKGDPA